KSETKKGYNKLVALFKKTKDWSEKSFIEKLEREYEKFLKENSDLENYNSLSILWDRHARDIIFNYYSIKSIRFSDIKGYSQQKKEFKTQINRFSEGKPINHIVLTGPPGTGKTSLVLAAANSYKRIKFLFLDYLLSQEDQKGKLPKVLAKLESYKHNCFVYADDKKYEDLSKIWDQIRSLLEGTKTFSHNIKLLLSTNHWNDFPLSFRTRFGTRIDLSYPDSKTQKTIAKHHKNKYDVGENISSILEEAAKISEDNISGRTIEKVCEKWGIYSSKKSENKNIKANYPMLKQPF
ncbi:DUF815 domain-containing protein, partial [Candidatus Woesearchaeota archaeon]|nr:DUF815 domain-containing protein [Candidatus Woesearchaeota archaeon]